MLRHLLRRTPALRLATLHARQMQPLHVLRPIRYTDAIAARPTRDRPPQFGDAVLQLLVGDEASRAFFRVLGYMAAGIGAVRPVAPEFG